MNDFFSPDDFPNNLEMEKEVLGAMLIRGGEIIPKLLNIINADDFYRPEHQLIFKHIVKLYLNGIEPNALSLIEDMRNVGLKGYVLQYALDVTAWTFTNAYALHHAKVIKEKSDLRKIILHSRILIDDAQKGLKSVNELVAQSHSALDLINHSSLPSKSLNISDYFANHLKIEIDNLKNYANRKTGFDNIDLNQFFSPGLYVIGATPAAGKTTFCWQLLEQLAHNGESCIFCSYEMSALELFTKTAARELFKHNPSANLTAADIRRGGWTNALDSIAIEFSTSKLNLQVIELQDESVDDLLNRIRPLCIQSEKAPVVCLDYLQIIPHRKDQSLQKHNMNVRMPFSRHFPCFYVDCIRIIMIFQIFINEFVHNLKILFQIKFVRQRHLQFFETTISLIFISIRSSKKFLCRPLRPSRQLRHALNTQSIFCDFLHDWCIPCVFSPLL